MVSCMLDCISHITVGLINISFVPTKTVEHPQIQTHRSIWSDALLSHQFVCVDTNFGARISQRDPSPLC